MGSGLVRRFALASLAIAGFAAACEGGHCTGDFTIPVKADQACPSPESAEERVEEYHENPSIEEPATTDFLVPSRICWYLVTFPTIDCEAFPTRESVVEWAMSRMEDYYPTQISCDEGRIVWPSTISAQVTTRSEAAPATLPECPADPPRRTIQVDDVRGDIGELVASDVIPGRVLCNYHINYDCNGGCGTVPGGNGLQ